MMLLYYALSFILLPVYFIIILIRLLIGKEDIRRIQERFAIGKHRQDDLLDFVQTSANKEEFKGDTSLRTTAYTLIREDEGLGPTYKLPLEASYTRRLIWLHAASVGESMVALTLIHNISKRYPDVRFLVTSWTNSSAKILTAKLPKIAVHQFLPIDNIIFTRKFLRNWQPDLGIFIESELWPCTINEGAKQCKLLLVNARISDQSFKAWLKRKSFFQLILKNCSKIIVQSERDLQKFNELGVSDAVNLGNIKFANEKLPVNQEELSKLSLHLNNRRVVLFASTHPEDEEVILPIIKNLKEQFLDCYIILIPRHPERVKSIIDNCKSHNLSATAKSQNDLPVLSDDLYIVDRFSEMGLFFSVSTISFIGGSFKQGGHNILEAAYFSNCIIFGPDMSKNTDIAKGVLQNEAAIQIKNGEDLLIKLTYLLRSNNALELTAYRENALKFVKDNQKVLDEYLKVITQFL
ncbi:3-deoxy-D-manno-octulosonic acid transferase [Rickettsia conorii subsp. heilongjiangensis]|uniref:3-deoxy-D-manno-octulosonic acid transferase n=1 Tax=Rickettsia conorii subsp. heilongjiangensis TaxID=226665 RepID=A0AAD1GHR8_RICCR|nr:lipid IV(A) 3-deoxy-D-manno-octulosonic acid transferase [Rickettsia conorii]AEK74161.1 3-deoxy-D-manno-octulosonic-acid transferase [Rickettsia conorii subsp. heilongjiangensis 054]BBM90949.1 3-deoxy-D-manno-octulosonic acid transferase [Rickettsia conorii subsp. heilongjiangensis]BBM92158.1 3-deoxy-D-manno-octulosonic acid transferase [Rickettsia conorii subsp. heilongjiangensis]BBM93367.1 3-deoxy-D-manno-octulosonic acid transferase [Rickettsia conorii subsp. heilongjiangensis]BBM94576.1